MSAPVGGDEWNVGRTEWNVHARCQHSSETKSLTLGGQFLVSIVNNVEITTQSPYKHVIPKCKVTVKLCILNGQSALIHKVVSPISVPFLPLEGILLMKGYVCFFATSNPKEPFGYI